MQNISIFIERPILVTEKPAMVEHDLRLQRDTYCHKRNIENNSEIRYQVKEIAIRLMKLPINSQVWLSAW